jgi:hypothetical protein
MVQNKTHWSPVRSFSHFKQSLRPTKYAPSYKPIALMDGNAGAWAEKCSSLIGGASIDGRFEPQRTLRGAAEGKAAGLAESGHSMGGGFLNERVGWSAKVLQIVSA